MGEILAFAIQATDVGMLEQRPQLIACDHQKSGKPNQTLLGRLLLGQQFEISQVDGQHEHTQQLLLGGFLSIR